MKSLFLRTVLFVTVVAALVDTTMFGATLPPSYYYSNPGDLNLILMQSIRSNRNGGYCNGNIRSWVFHIASAVYYTTRLIQSEGILPNISVGLTIVDMCGDTGIADMRMLELLANFEKEDKGPIIGLISSTSSRQATVIAQLMKHYKIPQTGTWATSNELSDKVTYPYYFRLIPSDSYQSNAAVDIVSHFGWSYISVIYQQDSYGLNAFKRIQNLAKQRKMCIAFSLAIAAGTEKENRDTVAELSKGLKENLRARVVISFVYTDDIINGALGVLNQTIGPGHFLFVFSESFGGDDEMYHEMQIGSFYLQLNYGIPDDYFDYLESHTAENLPGFTTNDTLLRAFVASSLQCDWIESNDTQIESCFDHLNVSLGQSYRPTYVAGFIDTVRMFGHSVRNLIDANCPEALKDKTLLKDCVNGSMVKEYLYNTTFKGYLEEMKINQDGDGMGQYELLQRIRIGSTIAKVKVGVWDALTTSLNFAKNVTWNTEIMLGDKRVPESVCSKPCDPGYFRLLSDSPCCWVCKKCRSNEVVTVNGSACDVCPETTWPNNFNNTCDEIEVTVPRWAEITTIVFLCFSTIGLLLVGVIGTLYILRRQDRLIKASSLSLSCIILSGVLLSYVTVYLVLSKPGEAVCGVRRQIFSLSYILIYAPILVKSNRIFRIFTAGETGNKRPHFIGSKAQLVFSFVIISIQVSLVSTMTSIVFILSPARVRGGCHHPFLVTLGCQNAHVFLPTHSPKQGSLKSDWGELGFPAQLTYRRGRPLFLRQDLSSSSYSSSSSYYYHL
jgi:metabotropic glutamate receptor 2/3/metabotropic glutamate receptor 6/7/8